MLLTTSVLLMLVVYVVACNRGVLYRGDGHFADQGIGAAINRYVVDLGSLDVTRVGEQRFVLAGLPSIQMAIGFQVGPPVDGEKVLKTKPLDADVQMKLTRADGQIVIDEQGRLETWVWSGPITGPESFVYRIGRSEQIDLGNGFSRTRPLDVRADGGWGTCFDPRWLHQYELAIRVREPATRHWYPVRILVEGGGWK